MSHHSELSPSRDAATDAGNGPTILIVDDHEAMTRGLAALFRDAGYRPVVFHVGLAAIEYVRGAGSKPALAVIDVHLPDISGLVLSQRLRDALGPAAPILVLSGDGSMEVLNSLAHVGATYFFRKPVSANHLLDRVKDLLAKPHDARADHS